MNFPANFCNALRSKCVKQVCNRFVKLILIKAFRHCGELILPPP